MRWIYDQFTPIIELHKRRTADSPLGSRINMSTSIISNGEIPYEPW